MDSGKQTIRAYGISNRIPCGMNSKICEAEPEFRRKGILHANMVEGNESYAGSGDRRAEYSGGPNPYDTDHTAEIFGQRGFRADKVQERKQVEGKVYVVGEGIFERKNSMVPWISCVFSGDEQAIDHKIRSMAGGLGFRSSEALICDEVPRACWWVSTDWFDGILKDLFLVRNRLLFIKVSLFSIHIIFTIIGYRTK